MLSRSGNSRLQTLSSPAQGILKSIGTQPLNGGPQLACNVAMFSGAHRKMNRFEFSGMSCLCRFIDYPLKIQKSEVRVTRC
jgi:hypothetical protein